MSDSDPEIDIKNRSRTFTNSERNFKNAGSGLNSREGIGMANDR